MGESLFVTQPKIEAPKRSDPLLWEKMRPIHLVWARNVLNQLNLDGATYARGMMLALIIGDDINCFIPSASGFNKKQAELSRKKIELIMKWEISVPELPDEIRERIIEIQDITSSLWENEESYFMAQARWLEMRDSVRQIISGNSVYSQAIDAYSDINNRILHSYWDEFLVDNKLARP